MAKHWGVASFVALALLACLVGTEVEATPLTRTGTTTLSGMTLLTGNPTLSGTTTLTGTTTRPGTIVVTGTPSRTSTTTLHGMPTFTSTTFSNTPTRTGTLTITGTARSNGTTTLSGTTTLNGITTHIVPTTLTGTPMHTATLTLPATPTRTGTITLTSNGIPTRTVAPTLTGPPTLTSAATPTGSVTLTSTGTPTRTGTLTITGPSTFTGPPTFHSPPTLTSTATRTGTATLTSNGTPTRTGIKEFTGITTLSGTIWRTTSQTLTGFTILDRPNLAIGGQQQQKNPQTPQRPHISNPMLSKPPPAESCEVSKSTRVPCGLPDITVDGCKDINCCFDGRNCYYGKAVTVQCTKDGHFIVVVARDATLPNIDLGSISLLSNDPGCSHVDSNSDFAIYYFPVTSCGTVVLEEPGVIIYENKMFSSYEVDTRRRGAITRDSHYELIFQGRYIGTTVQTVVAEVLPLSTPPLPVAALGPIRVELRLGNGQCMSKGCNEVDAAYTSCYTEADYPVTKVLREPVYVEVQLMEKTDPNLVLTLGRCWATTGPNPHSLPQWDILKDGCPYRNDNYLSSLVPVGPSSGLDLPSHYRRFLFKMFTFVDPNSMQPMKEQVYIHCSTAVCTPTAGYSCEPICYRKRRDVTAVDQTHPEPMVVVSVGPVSMVASVE